jgi:ATP-dependent RNA helicase DDX3X
LDFLPSTQTQKNPKTNSMSGDWVTPAAAPAADTWGTEGMAAALPEANQTMHDDNGQSGQNSDAASNVQPVVQVVPDALEGWVRPTAYDYTGEAPREWEGNAAVYEWDGEEGEIGPEFPELEIQLFGKPDERVQSHGIDFTR